MDNLLPSVCFEPAIWQRNVAGYRRENEQLLQLFLSLPIHFISWYLPHLSLCLPTSRYVSFRMKNHSVCSCCLNRNHLAPFITSAALFCMCLVFFFSSSGSSFLSWGSESNQVVSRCLHHEYAWCHSDTLSFVVIIISKIFFTNLIHYANFSSYYPYLWMLIT